MNIKKSLANADGATSAHRMMPFRISTMGMVYAWFACATQQRERKEKK